MRPRRISTLLAVLTALGGCGPRYSPNTYSVGAMQQAAKVDRGVVIGVRQVDVSAAGVVGGAAGAAAGGIAGSQAPGGGVGSAFGALGGALIGGLVGTGAEHVAGDTTAYEYIVRKSNGDLLSVTQKDRTPLALGTKVLLIEGKEARIVADYTEAAAPPAPPAAPPPVQTAPPPPPVASAPLAPLLPLPAFPAPQVSGQ